MSVHGHVAVSALDAKESHGIREESSFGTLNKYDDVGDALGENDFSNEITDSREVGSGDGGSYPEASKTENENDALTTFGWVGIPGDTYHVGEIASVHPDLRPPPLVVSGAGY